MVCCRFHTCWKFSVDLFFKIAKVCPKGGDTEIQRLRGGASRIYFTIYLPLAGGAAAAAAPFFLSTLRFYSADLVHLHLLQR